MKWLWRYLENEPEEPAPIILNILFWLLISLINVHLWNIFYFKAVFYSVIPIPIEYFILFLVSALFEEIECRAIGLFVVMLAYRSGYISKRLTGILLFITIAGISFFWFTVLHEHIVGWTKFAIQGVLGIILAIVYLKFGGMKAKLFKPLMTATLAHALYNFCIFSTIFKSI